MMVSSSSNNKMHTSLLKLIYIHNDLLHVSAKHVTIFRKIQYKEWVLLQLIYIYLYIRPPTFFIFCWPCISLQILGNNPLDALFYVFIYFMSLHVSSVTTLIIRRSNCTNISSGMISLCKWLLGMPVLTDIPSIYLHWLIIPDDVLIQFDLLMTGAVKLETCRDMK